MTCVKQPCQPKLTGFRGNQLPRNMSGSLTLKRLGLAGHRRRLLPGREEMQGQQDPVFGNAAVLDQGQDP